MNVFIAGCICGVAVFAVVFFLMLAVLGTVEVSRGWRG